MTIKIAELFINISIVLLSYFICAPLVGYVRAWAANKMGDDTPEQLGFVTLNPFAHVSRIWLILIVWLQVSLHYMPFALGRYIQINPLNIYGSSRALRLVVAYFSDTVAAVVLSIAAFFSILVIHGNQAAQITGSLNMHSLSAITPGVSTFVVILTWLLFTIFLMASLMAAFGLIINCFHFVYFYYFEDYLRDNEYANIIMLFGPLVLLYVMIYAVKYSVIKFVTEVAGLLAYLVGIVG